MPPNPEAEEPGQASDNSPDSQATAPPNLSNSGPGVAARGSSESEVAVEEVFPRKSTGGEGPPPPSGDEPGGEGEEVPGMDRMSFLDHLEELRHRIFYSLISILVGFVVCWTFADEIYAGLARPLTGILRELNLGERLVYTNPVAPFNLYVKLALLAGVFVASPFLLWQVWRFISPGLYTREKRYAVPFILLGSALFVSGGAFAYSIAFPQALRFLLRFGAQFQPMITVDEYFSLASMIILGLALVFELPILILFLTLLRLITPRFLLRNFRYSVLVIFVLAAIITPTPDIPTMMLFATPLIGLYFLGLGLSYLVLRLRGSNQD